MPRTEVDKAKFLAKYNGLRVIILDYHHRGNNMAMYTGGRLEVKATENIYHLIDDMGNCERFMVHDLERLLLSLN